MEVNMFLGIDWGTHSSKWACQPPNGRPIVGPIWDSTIWRDGNSLQMFLEKAHHQGQYREGGLKHSIILDHNQPFWEGNRRILGVTLGEATAFSIYNFLTDVQTQLQQRHQIRIDPASRIDIRFSLPNWLSPEDDPAIQNYASAVAVAIERFNLGQDWGVRNEESFGVEIDEWKAAVASVRQTTVTYGDYSATNVLQGRTFKRDNIFYSFKFESCAAGFPYIIRDEPDLFEEEIEDGSMWVRKILVVDVGAGSTDVGYILRTLQPTEGGHMLPPKQLKEKKPLLIYLPPASSCGVAGNWLTKRILEDKRLKEGKVITQIEAEIDKISSPDWHTKPFVIEWCQMISNHIENYVQSIPDETRLPKPPDLEIVMTGGSSVVEPLKKAVLESVRKGLKSRGLTDRTSLISSQINDDPRLAVCLGASNPRMVELKHYPKL
jgi:hypothetical protein